MIDPVILFFALLAVGACILAAPFIAWAWNVIASVVVWVTAFVIGTVWAILLILALGYGAYWLIVPASAQTSQTVQSVDGDVFVCNTGDGCFKNGKRISWPSGSNRVSLMAAPTTRACPFTYNGKQYFSIPLDEIQAAIEQSMPLVRKEQRNQFAIIATSEGCAPFDGMNIPGLLTVQ